jgi:hypothetical protein
VLVVVFCLLVGCSAASPNWRQQDALRPPSQSAVEAVGRELAANRHDPRYGAVLRGLQWCIRFCEDDENYDATFGDYLTLLDELTLSKSHPELKRIVHGLILAEVERAVPRLAEIFSPDGDGYEDFVAILPVLYRHQARIEPFRAFANRHFQNVFVANQVQEVRQAAKVSDYDRLTDLVINAVFIDMAYATGAAKDFDLPPNPYRMVMMECAKIPFRYKYNDEAYSDQNYYATHVLLALNHYGHRPLTSSPALKHVLRYLAREYDNVRHRADDLDLLCEYLYCLHWAGKDYVDLIAEGERYVISQQHDDGSWGTPEDFEEDPYDQLHPTWTAITLLLQGRP